MSKFTTEQLWKEWERNPEYVYRFVVTGQLFTSHLFEDVDVFTKASITRKAFRYVAEQSTKGTIPAAIVAEHLGFYKMECGNICPIGDDSCAGWIAPQSFTDKEGNLIHVELNPIDQITFRSLKGNKTVERPSGLHLDFLHICLDIPMIYEDERYDWKIK